MDVRKKLAELIREISHDKKLYLYDFCDMFEVSEKIADFLIENGVTVQEWISVAEPPKEYRDEYRALKECKCGSCVDSKNFELKKDYGLTVETDCAAEDGGWIKPEERMPEEDECVLVIVSGVFGNITFKNAVELAEHTAKEGWILESFPEHENPIIKWWRAIPEPTKGE